MTARHTRHVRELTTCVLELDRGVVNRKVVGQDFINPLEDRFAR